MIKPSRRCKVVRKAYASALAGTNMNRGQRRRWRKYAKCYSWYARKGYRRIGQRIVCNVEYKENN